MASETRKIIGGGLSGLAAAINFAKNDEKVEIHEARKDIGKHCLEADIIVAAVGSPDTITSSMVKPGAVVIDVGVNRTENGLVGDTSSDVKEVAGQLTPVPGGVGPMTVAMLMSNVVDAALKTG